MAAVVFDHVEKVYPGGTRGLVDCNLQIADGELVVLVGPSGCGKSTALRLVAGLETPTGGTLRIGDRAVNTLQPQERNVAMVFQDYALYPHLTARGNLEFPLKMRRLGRDERRQSVEAIAKLLDIGALLDRLPRQLSGGQRQRVAMGRALVRQPSVFLLDEPLSNLDAKLRVQVRAEIKELQRRTRTTMLYVTHDQVEAMTLGDRVAVLNLGRVQQVAPPGALYDGPANAFVAAFIGNPPMNVFPSRADGSGGTARIQVGTQRIPIAPASADVLAQVRSAGVRPEAIALARTAADADALQATVEHLESLGHETLAHVRVNDVRLVARLEGMHRFASGETVTLRIDPARVHLFADDGTRLPTG